MNTKTTTRTWYVRPEEPLQSDAAAAERGPSRRVHTRVNLTQILIGVVLAAILVVLGWSVLTNKNMGWDIVVKYLFSPLILKGISVTIELTVLSMVIAVVGGAVVALMSQSRNIVARAMGGLYVWFFRGTPLLVQLIFWYNLALLFPRIGLGIPGTDIWMDWDTNQVISGFTAAVLGLSLHEAAYMSEIIRGGINGIPKGQMDAALSIGLRRGAAMRKVILPQTLRIIIPPTANQFISTLKSSSLVAVIGGGDLLTCAQWIYSENFKVIPLLLVATLWFLVMTTAATVAESYLERWFCGNKERAPITLIAPANEEE
ncbi:MAG: amino acid ABC transporter permease [Bifidobacteriaceae bacterium]|nr:amino acid ABC transporter permease [Bifidobacteriaceae bacterium]